MSMHHDASAPSQNQGNSLGTRPVIRQSKYFRQYESGNATKSLLGVGHLAWNEDKVEGAFKGVKTFDPYRVERGRRPEDGGNGGVGIREIGGKSEFLYNKPEVDRVNDSLINGDQLDRLMRQQQQQRVQHQQWEEYQQRQQYLQQQYQQQQQQQKQQQQQPRASEQGGLDLTWVQDGSARDRVSSSSRWTTTSSAYGSGW